MFILLCRNGVPGSQSVTEEFALGWPEVLLSSHDVALAWVDGRSDDGRVQKAPANDPRKLGSLIVKDQLGVVELVSCNVIQSINYMRNICFIDLLIFSFNHRWLMQLPYIDDRRMALYGKVAIWN